MYFLLSSPNARFPSIREFCFSGKPPKRTPKSSFYKIEEYTHVYQRTVDRLIKWGFTSKSMIIVHMYFTYIEISPSLGEVADFFFTLSL